METGKSKRSGFRKIDNNLFHAIMSAQLTGAGYQILLTVIDKTLGFQKESAKISLTCFHNATGLSRQSVRSAVKQAEERQIIQVKRDSTRPTIYSLNNYREWLTRERNHPSKLGNEITPNWETKSPQTRKLAMPRTRYPKETLKETSKERVRTKETRVLNITSYEGTSPPQTPPSLERISPITREGPTVKGNLIKGPPKNTYRERIIAYLDANGPTAIKAIAKGTEIGANLVNVTLHNGKGKVFYHDSEKRAWGMIEDRRGKPKTDDTLNTLEAILCMSVERALEIWHSLGAPVIHLGLGENCFDLLKLLSNPNAKYEHLEAVSKWLEGRHKLSLPMKTGV